MILLTYSYLTLLIWDLYLCVWYSNFTDLSLYLTDLTLYLTDLTLYLIDLTLYLTDLTLYLTDLTLYLIDFDLDKFQITKVKNCSVRESNLGLLGDGSCPN